MDTNNRTTKSLVAYVIWKPSNSKTSTTNNQLRFPCAPHPSSPVEASITLPSGPSKLHLHIPVHIPICISIRIRICIRRLPVRCAAFHMQHNATQRNTAQHHTNMQHRCRSVAQVTLVPLLSSALDELSTGPSAARIGPNPS